MIKATRICAAYAAHISLVVGFSVALAGSSLRAQESSAQPGESRRLAELFYQLQVLQQEVQELRGLVEEQGYQIKRMARDQQEQYIDLDRRVSGMRSAPSSAPTPAAGVATGPPSAGDRAAVAGPFSATGSESRPLSGSQMR